MIGKTLLRDENPEVALTLIKLNSILVSALKDKNGKIQKLDLLGFDGCLMGMLEAAYELKDVAKVMVASEGNIPASGWSYETVLAPIKSNSCLTPEEFAISIVDQYPQFNSDYSISGRSVNIAPMTCQHFRGPVRSTTASRISRSFSTIC